MIAAASHPSTKTSDHFNLDDAVASIRALSRDGTAAAVAQGRILVQIEEGDAFRPRFASMSAFLREAPLGISAKEALKRMQVARMVDAEPGIPSGLCLAALKLLVPLAAHRRDVFDVLLTETALTELTVTQMEDLVVRLVDRRRTATPERTVERFVAGFRRARETMATMAADHIRTIADEARQVLEYANSLLGADSRHEATPSRAHVAHVMESMDHESMVSERDNSMDMNHESLDEQVIETPVGAVALPATGEAVIRALASMGYGKAREQAALLETHGVTALAEQIACIRWELLRGGTHRNGRIEPIKNPGALLRRRLAAGFQPPEYFYAAVRPERQHEVLPLVPQPAPAPSPVMPEPLAVSLPPILQRLVTALRSLPGKNGVPSWALMACGLIESGEARLSDDGVLEVKASNPVGSSLVRKWADDIAKLGIVRGVAFA